MLSYAIMWITCSVRGMPDTVIHWGFRCGALAPWLTSVQETLPFRDFVPCC